MVAFALRVEGERRVAVSLFQRKKHQTSFSFPSFSHLELVDPELVRGEFGRSQERLVDGLARRRRRRGRLLLLLFVEE